MAGRKDIPEVARPTPGQRAVEWCKDLLILLLTCSAFFLVSQTPMADQLKLLTAQPVQSALPSAARSEEAAIPYAIAVRSDLGLYGASYDAPLVERAFGQLSSLLGEGLSTAGPAETISRHQWQLLLESPGVYCAFQGTPPLAALEGWLGTGAGAPEGGAESLLLSYDGSRVWLCWREGDLYRRSATTVAYDDHLEEALGAFSPNGAAFASTLVREDGVYASLDGDVLVSMAAPSPQNYTLSSPDFVGDSAALERLLEALGFRSGANSAYETAGDLAINENDDRLRLSSQGTVSFHTGGGGRYLISSQEEIPTLPQCVQAAWELLDRSSAPWRGEGEYVLTGAEPSEGGWTITFQARLGGVPVLTGGEGWAAQFVTTGREISAFTLTLRSYTPTETNAVVPAQRLAAAALQSLPQASGKLKLCYRDLGGSSLTAGWMCTE